MCARLSAWSIYTTRVDGSIHAIFTIYTSIVAHVESEIWLASNHEFCLSS